MGKSKTNPENLRSYADINALSGTVLNQLCRQHKLQAKMPRKAKQNLLALVLGIQTDGSSCPVNQQKPRPSHISLSGRELSSYNLLTPPYLAQLDGWSKDIHHIADIDDNKVKQYLLKARQYSNELAARQYKISRPYQLRQFIHSMLIHQQPVSGDNTFIVIQAQCNASQSTSHDEVKVLFVILRRSDAEPLGAYCTCTVGKCQACGHVGAALFRLAELVAEGHNSLPDNPSVTEQLCSWLDPKGSGVAPKTVDEIVIGKHKRTGVRRTIDEFGQMVNPERVPVSVCNILRLRADLFALESMEGLVEPVSAVRVLTADNFGRPHQPPAPITSLPHKVSAVDPCLVPSHVEEVASTCVAMIPLADMSNIAAHRLSYSKADRKIIEISTRGQSSNVEWFRQRRGSLTTTKFNRIRRFMSGQTKISRDKLVADVMGDRYKYMLKPTPTQVPSLKWGIDNEPKAREAYVIANSHHKNLRVLETGLIVDRERPYLRGSPDGIVTCDCHPPRILEIKCPASKETRSTSFNQLLENGQLNYLQLTPNGPRMLVGSDYYDQVQGSMGITQLKSCDFVVYLPDSKTLGVVPIPFNAKYWEVSLLPQLDRFWEQHIIPQIGCIQIKEEPKSPKPTNKMQSILQPPPLKPLLHCTTSRPLLATTPDPGTPFRPAKSRPTTTRRMLDVQASPTTTDRKPFTDITAVRLSDGNPNDDICLCSGCQCILPEADSIAADNSNASVGCDCPDCDCEKWFCWPCAQYTPPEDPTEEVDWFCVECVRKCENVYKNV